MLTRLRNIILAGLNSFSEVLSPDHCMVCKAKITADNQKYDFLCLHCFNSMPFSMEPAIMKNRLINIIGADNLAITNVYSLFSVAEDFRYIELIHSLKYFGIKKVGALLGTELGRIIKTQGFINYDYILPVPIHRARIRERGFNQSSVIGRSLADYLELDFTEKAIFRKKYTSTQTLLTKEERKKNVTGAFSIYKNFDARNKTFLIIDDVLTTGSTINAAALCLIEGGAERIDCATLASA